MSNRIRVVLDTNVVVSALLFRNGRLRPLRLAWQAGQVAPVVSRDICEELLRVLGYRKFKLSPAEIQELLALYIPHAETHAINAKDRTLARLPSCRDADDQKFLELAHSAKVDWLVTGDEDLLSLELPSANPLYFGICTPLALLERLAHP